MLHVSSFSQSGIRRPQRANAVFKAEVPAEFVTALAEPVFIFVDVSDLTTNALNKLSNRLPALLAQPCRSCGGYPKHHVWCPMLGLNVLAAVHVQNYGDGARTCLPVRTTKSFAENSV